MALIPASLAPRTPSARHLTRADAVRGCQAFGYPLGKHARASCWPRRATPQNSPSPGNPRPRHPDAPPPHLRELLPPPTVCKDATHVFRADPDGEPGCELCTGGSTPVANRCTCPPERPDAQQGKGGLICLPPCPKWQKRFKGRCTCVAKGSVAFGDQCVPACPRGKGKIPSEPNGECKCRPEFPDEVKGRCLPACADGLVRNSFGRCDCPTGMANFGGGCGECILHAVGVCACFDFCACCGSRACTHTDSARPVA